MRQQTLDLAALVAALVSIPIFSARHIFPKLKYQLGITFLENRYNLVFVRVFYPQFRVLTLYLEMIR